MKGLTPREGSCQAWSDALSAAVSAEGSVKKSSELHGWRLGWEGQDSSLKSVGRLSFVFFCFWNLRHIKCFLMQKSRSNLLSQSGSRRLCRVTTEKGRLLLAESKAEELVPREYENRSAGLCRAGWMRS